MSLRAGFHEVPNGHLAAVVTYFEMTSAKMTGAKPFPTGVSVTREFMGVDAYRDLFRQIGQDWLWVSRLTLSDAELAAILHNEKVETWVVRRDGNAIALVELDFTESDICELAFFGMVKAETGKGLGGPMMALAQTEAFSRNVARLQVHTCTLDSPTALAFYQKAGFSAYKRAVETFEDPRLGGQLPPDAAPNLPIVG